MEFGLLDLEGRPLVVKDSLLIVFPSSEFSAAGSQGMRLLNTQQNRCKHFLMLLKVL